MDIEILIGSRLHGVRRGWTSVPAVGHDVWVKNVFAAPREVPEEDIRDGFLKVIAVLWREDKVQVNLEPPNPAKFGL